MPYIRDSEMAGNGCARHPDCFTCPLAECQWEPTMSGQERDYILAHRDQARLRRGRQPRRQEATA